MLSKIVSHVFIIPSQSASPLSKKKKRKKTHQIHIWIIDFRMTKAPVYILVHVYIFVFESGNNLARFN